MEAETQAVPLSIVEEKLLRLARLRYDQRIAAADRELDDTCKDILEAHGLRGVEGKFEQRIGGVVFVFAKEKPSAA